jgi:dethiobiotin synthetase
LVEVSNRSALERLAPVRAVLPAGASAAGDFAAISAAALDGDWVRSLVS